jgi:hypothetical protein
VAGAETALIFELHRLAPYLRPQISEGVVTAGLPAQDFKHFSIASFSAPDYEPASAFVALIRFLPFLIIPI